MNLHENSQKTHKDSLDNAKYSHATIIRGGSDAARTAHAEKLAASFVCTGSGKKPCMSCIHCEKASRHIHPDIILIDRNPETRTIYIDQLRAVREDAVIMPNEAETKVYIINHADSMNIPAQNAILKVLEEPPESARFILVAENAAELLPTIRSRCVELSVPVSDTVPAPSASDTVLAFYGALTDGPLKLTEFSFVLEKLDKCDFIDFINDAKSFFVIKMRAHLAGETSHLPLAYLMKVVRVLDRAIEYFEYNVGLGHIAGMVCAELIVRNEDKNDRSN